MIVSTVTARQKRCHKTIWVTPKKIHCVADECMAWVWHDKTNRVGGCGCVEPQFYCQYPDCDGKGDEEAGT